MINYLKEYADSLCASVPLSNIEGSSDSELLEIGSILRSISFLALCALIGAIVPYLIGYLFFNWIPFASAEKLKFIMSNSIYSGLLYHLEENNQKLFFGALVAMPIAIVFLFFAVFATKAKEYTWWISSIAICGIGMTIALAAIFIQGTTNLNFIIPLVSLFLSIFLAMIFYKLIQKKIMTLEKMPYYLLVILPLWIILVSYFRYYLGLSTQPIFQNVINISTFLLIYVLTLVLTYVFNSIQNNLHKPHPKWAKWRYAHVITFNSLAFFFFIFALSNKPKNLK